MEDRPLTRTEESLLLYVETRAVDHSGIVDRRHLNEEDIALLQQWNAEGFVFFGRICYKDIGMPHCSDWCRLSDEAYRLAAQKRRERADRSWKDKRFMTTDEKMLLGDRKW